ISQQPGLLLGINKVGPGKIIFTNANTYAGQTTVAQGILNVQNNDALGLFGPPISPGSLPSPLIHDWELNNSFADALGGPALTPIGGTLNATNFTWNAVAEPPGQNQGLFVSNALPNPANYSIEMVFNITNTNGALLNTGWVNLVDFKDRTADTGLYNFRTALEFFPSPIGANGAFTPGVDVHLVITRNSATNQFVAYINGVQQFSFIDSSSVAVFDQTGNIIRFFTDDFIVRN